MRWSNVDAMGKPILQRSVVLVIGNCIYCHATVSIPKKLAPVTARLCNKCRDNLSRVLKREEDIWNKL